MQIDLDALMNKRSVRTSFVRPDWRFQLFEEYEHQKRNGFLYLPIFLALGIAGYFALPTEPPLVVGFFFTLLSLLSISSFAPRFKTLPVVLFLISLGFLAGQIRTHIVHTPILQKEIGPTMVKGDILALEDFGQDEGARLILSNVEIEDLANDKTPRKIRIKVRRDVGLYVGQRIEALAKLHPPSPPLIPGGFDFQRYLYFQGIGAVGFSYSDAKILKDISFTSFTQHIERLRQYIGARIETHMAYPASGMVAALTIGRKSAIAEKDQEAMRASGLAHMLAISGLHVGLFSGALFFVLRLFMAFVPNMALRHPIKKYAAVIAMIGAIGYMLIAGASIPTQRAVLMTAIIFGAILIDRSPISLRLVAFAAFIVLLIFSESLLSASFHMSFAAVTALVVFYDWLRPYWSRWSAQSGILRRAGLYFVGVSITSIVATLATAPFALFHFQQLAAYGVIANLIAVPLLAFTIMPSILLALLLMPAGLDFIPLYGGEFGVNAVLDVAHWVSSLPHAVFRHHMWPSKALLVLVFAGLYIIFARGYWRLFAMVPIALSLLTISAYKMPDIIISGSAKLVAVNDGHTLSASTLSSDRFTREGWLQVFGFSEDDVEKWPKEGKDDLISCGEMGCRVESNEKVISYIHDEASAKQICANSDIVIAPFPLRSFCDKAGAKVIDLYAVREQGAHSILLNEQEAVIKTSESERGKRPWSALNTDF